MSESPTSPESFRALIARVRAGDEQAAAELVRRYEPAIRRAARVRLVDTRLNRLLDSMDICQSVLASFFFRAASGQYDLDRPEQLSRLLFVMARNKLISQARKPQVVRRETRLPRRGALDDQVLLAPAPSPSQQAAWRDLLEQVHLRLSEEERRLVERRVQCKEWSEIAAELGGSPEALRKKLARALDRVARHLGLDELQHG
jgi:RNA polymerase sigma factor (sigma-70 family)